MEKDIRLSEKTIKLNINQRKYKISYIEAGNKDNPKIFLLHSHLNLNKMFTPIIPALSVQFHVIAPNMPGYGKTTPLDLNTIPGYANWLKFFMNRLKIKSATLFGVSMGGVTSLKFAADNPSIVSTLILQSVAYKTANIIPTKAKVARAICDQIKKRRMIEPIKNGIKSEFLNSILSGLYQFFDPTTRFVSRKVSEEFTKEIIENSSLEAVLDMVEYFLNFDISNDIKAIKNPTLVAYGKKDMTISYKTGNEISKLNKNIEYKLYDNEPHLFTITSPEKSIADILYFYNKFST